MSERVVGRTVRWWTHFASWENFRYQVGQLWCAWRHPEWRRVGDSPDGMWSAYECPTCGRWSLRGNFSLDLKPGERAEIPLPSAIVGPDAP